MASNTANLLANQALVATDVLTTYCSFETDEQTTMTIFVPVACTVTKIRAQVIGALAATDDGTIQAKNNAGTNMANGLLTLPASTVAGTEFNVTPTTNNTFTAGQKIQLTAAKTTPGGTAVVFVEITRATPGA